MSSNKAIIIITLTSITAIIITLCLIKLYSNDKNHDLVHNQSNDCFRAAVYEHIYRGNKSENPQNIIQQNLDIYETIASKASEFGSNILVFPEDGIIDPEYPRNEVANIAEKIPDPKEGDFNPCEHPLDYKRRPITLRLSCFAKKYNLYIVADYGDRIDCNITSDANCPKDGYYLFNTAVAFNTNGSIVAKYHKMQLFFEPMYNIPPKEELIYFDTPFGRMGLQICFDIMFKNPGTGLVHKHGVQTMLFPTYWFDELPLLSAKQIQEGWSVTNQVNLLAANLKSFKTATTGSGIYSGQNGPIIYTNITEREAKLLIADIPIDSKNSDAKCLSNGFKKSISLNHLKDILEYKPMNMSPKDSTLFRLKSKNNMTDVCNNGFCCRLQYTVESESTLNDESYWLFVANISAKGSHETGYPMCQEICGVFRCVDENCKTFSTNSKQTIFKSLKLSAKFSTNYSYPSLTSNDLQLIPKNKWIYENDGQIGSEIKLSLNDFNKPVVAMGLYGRCFDRDLPYKQLGFK